MYSIRMHTRSHYANNEHRLVCSKIASLKCAHCSLSMYTCTVYVNYVDYDNGFDYICTFHIQCERSGAGVEMHEPSKKLYGLTFLSQCFAISLSVCMCVSVSSVFFSTFIFGRVFFRSLISIACPERVLIPLLSLSRYQYIHIYSCDIFL